MWYNRFKEDLEDFNDSARPGRLGTSSTTVKKMILNNRRITIRRVSDDFGISFDLCQGIFTDALGIKSAIARIVPQLINCEQKQRRMNIAQEMLAIFNEESD